MATSPELRLALAMRGGVSLAVWMGGACCEVDRLRRALDEEEPDATTYAELLRAAGFGSVAVDVVAGASAGGLNSVLMSCSVVHGMRFDDRIRDLWLRLGDIGALTRHDGARPPASLLDGDRGFYGTLLPELEKLLDAAEAPAPSAPMPEGTRPRLDAVLTCTLFSPVDRTRYQDLGPPIVEHRNRAWFRFRNLPEVPEAPNDFGLSGQDQTDFLPRLAYAARTTSSFPAAFEPASVGYAPGSRAPVPQGAAAPLPPTHYGCFSESRTDVGGGGRDFVFDGGVLDNIPVGWAIRSIAAAPADRSVDRWLVYLQPLPFPPSDHAPAHLPGLDTTAQRALNLRGGTEALADDLDELEAVQRRGQRRQGYGHVLEYALGQLPTGEDLHTFLAQLYERALAAVPDYRELAGDMEATRIRELWIDPLPVLGADPLGFRDFPREPLPKDAGEVLLQRLPGSGPDLVLDSGEPGSGATALAQLLRTFRSPQALARTVAVLLDAARELGDPALGVKADLYGVRSDIEVAVAKADRALARQPRSSPQLSDPVELARLAAWDAVAQGEPGGPGWPERVDLWDRLVELAQDLARCAGATQQRAFVRCLVGAAAEASDPRTATAAVLATVELLTGPSSPDPLAETSHIRFHMLSAQNSSPLIDDAVATRPDVGSRLAGAKLGHFGAFLSARWRLNDWTWGRLDAASSLVELICQPRADGADPLVDLRTLAGLPQDANRAAVREAWVRRLHDQILRDELPLFAEVDDAPPGEGLLQEPLPPGAALDVTPLVETVRETLPQLIKRDPRRLSIAGQLAFNAGYAVTTSTAASLTKLWKSRGIPGG